jgi:molybdopterin/thiamine biosynthesis adenylyltransferase
MERLKTLSVVVCGAGALGANLIETLARQGFGKLTVIDKDRVEERNLSTQPYGKAEIGGQKAKMLANTVYRAVGVSVEAKVAELTAANVGKLLTGAGVVVDVFDNAASRRVVADYSTENAIPCLHAGLSGDGYAEVLWNENYRVPSDTGADLCDYPLARNLVLLTVSVTAETLVRYAADGTRSNWTITLGDLAVLPQGL